MASIDTGIALNDGFSRVMEHIIRVVDMAVGQMEVMQQTMSQPVQTGSIVEMRNRVNQAVEAYNELADSMKTVAEAAQMETTSIPQTPYIPPVNPEPVNVMPYPEAMQQKVIQQPVAVSQPRAPPVPSEAIEIPARITVTNQPIIETPDELTVPIVPEIVNQTEIKIPEEISVPVTPEVVAQPVIETPDRIEIPVDVSVMGSDAEVQEIGGLAGRLNEVTRMQEAIRNVASNLYVLPDETVEEIRSVNGEIARMEKALDFLNENPFSMDSSVAKMQIQSISDGLDDLMAQQSALNTSMGNLPSQQLLKVTVDRPDPLIEPPQPVRVPVEWQAEPLEVYTGSGMERFRQEAENANQMLSRLSNMQISIAKQAYNTDIIPPEAFQDVNRLASRINLVQQRILQFENNPVHIGTDKANTALEQLRAQLSQALQEQNQLNVAMAHMDVAAINASYLKLSQTIGGTERYIRDNVIEQGNFNQELQEGIQHANGLTNMIKQAAGAYLGIQGVKNALNLSDTMIQTTARLGLIVDDGGSVEELQNKIFASAQNARGSYMATADAVSKLGMQAADAFSSNDELIAFTELLNKSFVNAGTSVQGVDSVMLQLTQAMAAGKLQGEELNAVLDNAAPIVQNIQRYLEEVQGVDASNIKQLAADGEITAQLIKNAMFYAADDINAKFNSMPMTWGQIWQSMQNTAMMAFQSVLQRINDMANSEAFQSFVNGAIEAMTLLASVALNVFDLIGTAGGFIADNWSIISPIVYGVIGALAVYAAYLGVLKALELASAAAKGVLAAAEFVHVAAVAAQTGATISATAAQMGLNGAMYACPIVWIVMMIIALIAVIFAVCSAIAKMTGIAQSGFGVITGSVMVAIAFFQQLLSAVITIFGAIGAAAGALGHNIVAAFHNSIANVQTFFYNLLSTAMSVIAKIASALSQLPFVEFDASGLAGAADDYAAKARAAQDSKMEYEDIGAVFSSEMSKMTAFSDGWVSDAFQKGAAWGDGIVEKVDNFSLADAFGGKDLIPNVEDYTKGVDDAIANGITDSGIADNSGSTAGNTAKMADSLSASEEDLKYLRDIAERDTINRFTTAEITVNQTNHNNINSNMDVDGVIERMTDGMVEAIEITEEGVHE